MNFSGALAKGVLPATLREELAISTADQNGCDYCLSAHTAGGRMLKIGDDDLAAARHGNSSDPKVAAALHFSRTIVEKHGEVSDADVAAVRAAGYSDAEVVEIVAHTALNIFTNYFNIIAQTEVDFPKLKARA